MKAPLLTERPYPIAEIVRRMVRIRCKYEDSEDFNERGLLRGEYKYYSGKAAEVRGADTADMIALLDCYAFFGFWDNTLLGLVEAKLLERVLHLDTLELLLLYKALPGIQRQASELYLEVCDRLASMAVEQLSLGEAVSVVERAVAHTPQRLIQLVILGRVVPQAAYLEPLEHGAGVLRGLTLLENLGDDPRLFGLARDLIKQLSELTEQLPVSRIAEVVHHAALIGVLRDQLDGPIRLLTTSFVARSRQAGPAAVSLMIEALAETEPLFIIRVGDAIKRQGDFMSPQQCLVCLDSLVDAAVSMDSMTAAERSRMPAVEETIELLISVVGHLINAINGSEHVRDPAVLVSAFETLARIPEALRPSITAFYPCCHAVSGALSGAATRLDPPLVVRYLDRAAALRSGVSETLTMAVLNRAIALGALLPATDAGDLLRQLKCVPPLPTASARGFLQYRVLPSLLERAGG